MIGEAGGGPDGLKFAWICRDWRSLAELLFETQMPTYEYTCLKCGQNFDAFQSMRDEAYKTCPKELCRLEKWGKGKVKRLLGTGAGLIFKGSGFYTTDYRSDSYKEGAKKDTASGGEKKSESAPAKTESKPATPPPSAPAKKKESNS